MRVLQINSVYKRGSTGKIIHDLHTYFLENGHESAIAYGRGDKVDEADIYRFAPVWEVYAHAALAGWTGCFSPLATLEYSIATGIKTISILYTFCRVLPGQLKRRA